MGRACWIAARLVCYSYISTIEPWAILVLTDKCFWNDGLEGVGSLLICVCSRPSMSTLVHTCCAPAGWARSAILRVSCWSHSSELSVWFEASGSEDYWGFNWTSGKMFDVKMSVGLESGVTSWPPPATFSFTHFGEFELTSCQEFLCTEFSVTFVASSCRPFLQQQSLLRFDGGKKLGLWAVSCCGSWVSVSARSLFTLLCFLGCFQYFSDHFPVGTWKSGIIPFHEKPKF